MAPRNVYGRSGSAQIRDPGAAVTLRHLDSIGLMVEECEGKYASTGECSCVWRVLEWRRDCKPHSWSVKIISVDNACSAQLGAIGKLSNDV